MRQHRALLTIFSTLFGLFAVIPAQADIVAYQDPASQGTQPWEGNLTLDFSVTSTITVTALGVFNANGNGITGPIQVAIFNNSTLAEVTPVVTFSGTAAPPTGTFDVFQSIAPVVLGPGSYAVDAVGFGPNDLNGNLNTGSSSGPTLNGGGALTFTGAGYDSSTSLDDPLPSTCPSCTANQFDAGTFKYVVGRATSMDEASTVTELSLTMGLAALALLWVRRRMSHRSA